MAALKTNLKPLKQVLRPTTFISSPRLNQVTGLNVTLASETFQITGSFKFRAAYNLALNVPNKHIVAASSGNFGQALAYACKLLGKRCTVVMPDNSAKVKIQAVQEYGGKVELVNTQLKSRAQRVAELIAADSEAYQASAFDNIHVIEGNASLGDEIIASAANFDAVLVPVGGGGLIGGIIKAVKDAGSHISVIGVEPILANDAARSLRAGRIIANDGEPQTIADGVRTLQLGEHNWQYIQNGVSEIIEVEDDAILDAMRKLFSLSNLKAEPTGALSLAGALSAPGKFRGKSICCVVSGGNMDPEVFHRIICNEA